MMEVAVNTNTDLTTLNTITSNANTNIGNDCVAQDSNTNLTSSSLVDIQNSQHNNNNNNNNNNSNSNANGSYPKTALTSNLSISNRSSGGSCRSTTNGRPRKPGSNYVFKEENIQSYTDANGVVYKVAGKNKLF